MRRGDARHIQIPESTRLETDQSLLDGSYPVELFWPYLVPNKALHPGPRSWRETGLRTYVALARIDQNVHLDLDQDFLVLVDRGVKRREVESMSDFTNQSRFCNFPLIFPVVIRNGISGTYTTARVRRDIYIRSTVQMLVVESSRIRQRWMNSSNRFIVDLVKLNAWDLLQAWSPLSRM